MRGFVSFQLAKLLYDVLYMADKFFSVVVEEGARPSVL